MRSDRLCECGCGEFTNRARNSDPSRGIGRGEALPYLRGHNRRKTPYDYLVSESGCWVWQRSIDSAGYGKAWDGSALVVAHRLYYERAHGEIADGLVVDHLCRNKLCVNPGHLEAVTVTENNDRSFFGRDARTGRFLAEVAA